MKTFLKISIILTIITGAFGAVCQNETSRKVQNIETFARLYGYARWFHPSDEAQEIDWDKFAVLGVQKVENIKSSKELRDTLFRLFAPIVQGLQIYETDKPEKFNSDILLSPDPNAKSVAWQHYGVYLNEKSNIYKSFRVNSNTFDEVSYKNYQSSRNIFGRIPPFGEFIHEPIDNQLTCVVPLTLLTNDAATYPKTETSSFARLKSEISNINFRNEFNPQVNLASVVIAWNVLQHFFPYFDVIDTDWNSVLGETLKSTLTNERKKDFYVTLSRMIAQIDDGHGIVFGEQMYHLPIRTEFIENKIVITASNDTALKRGDIINKIDGKPVMEELYEIEKRISGSPHLRRHRALNIFGSKLDLFLGSKLDLCETNFTIERGGKEQNVTIPNSYRDKSMFFNPIDERQYLSETIVEIEPRIYYVNLVNCTADDFIQKIKNLANAKAVIYDYRGGEQLSFFDIAPFLIKKPVTSAWWNVPQTIYPNRREVEFSKSNWKIQPRKPFFKSKTIIINVPAVVSSGETMMGILDHYNLAITVGEPTAGCNGNVNQINLPCGYSVWWTGMKVLKHDGSQLYLEGFKPDYPVNKTIQAIREGRDEYLEKALEVARNK